MDKLTLYETEHKLQGENSKFNNDYLTPLCTTFTIEMSPPIYFHYAGSIQPILKNKKSFKNYEKLSNQL